MEYCSLEDAFPQIDNRSLKDKEAGSKAARLAKKKAKKMGKESVVRPPIPPALSREDLDPDRQAFAKFEILEKFQTVRGNEEIPTLPTAPSIITKRADISPDSTVTVPSYFGKGLEDEEGFSSFTSMIGDDPNYLLNPAALDSAFDAQGAARAGSSAFDTISPPVPNTIDVWKTVLPAGSYSSFLTSAPSSPPSGERKPRREASDLAASENTNPLRTEGHLTDTYDSDIRPFSEEKEELLKKIESLKKRIDQLEVRREEDTQTELLLFVCTGIFLQFGLQSASMMAS